MPCGRIFANWSLSEVEKPQKGIVKEPGQLLSGIASGIVYFNFTERAAISWEEQLQHLISRKKCMPYLKFQYSMFFVPKSSPVGM